MEDYEIVNKISAEINAIHNTHATRLLKTAGLDAEAYKKDPNMLREQGYVFVHESKGDDHRFVIAKVVAEDKYSINVKFDVGTKDLAEEEGTNDPLEK